MVLEKSNNKIVGVHVKTNTMKTILLFNSLLFCATNFMYSVHCSNIFFFSVFNQHTFKVLIFYYLYP